MSLLRTRWAAVGAVVAITLGAGGIGIVSATVSSGDRAVFVPIEPCRIMDTRPGFVIGSKSSPLGPEEVHDVSTHGTNGECTLPNDASGLVLNVTATDATLPTFVAIWGDGTRPNASSLNPTPGQPPTPNAVTTDLTAGGQFNIFNKQGTVNVFVDVVGYYANHNHDDRYYKKSEIDARKFMNIQMVRDDGEWPRLNPGSTISVTSLAVPPDYTTGTPMTIRLNLLHIEVPSMACQVEFDEYSLFVYRVGVDRMDDLLLGPTAGVSDDGIVSFDAVNRQLRSTDITITQPGTIPLAAGDSISLFARVDAASTCTPDKAIIHSAALYYD